MKFERKFSKFFIIFFTIFVMLSVLMVPSSYAYTTSTDTEIVAIKTYSGKYVCAEDGGGKEVVANRREIGKWETFEIIDLGNDSVALKTYNGSFIRAKNDNGREVDAKGKEIGDWETFEIVDLGKNRVALKAHNGYYVCAEDGGGGILVANREEINEWETFQFVKSTIKLPETKKSAVIALKAYNDKYVCAEDGGGSEIVANRDRIGTWEKFELQQYANKQVTFQVYDGHYIRVKDKEDGTIKADVDKVSDWSKFNLYYLGNDKIAIKAYNGMFLGVDSSDGNRISARYEEIRSNTIFKLADEVKNDPIEYRLNASSSDNSVSFTWSITGSTSNIVGYNLYRGTASGKQSSTPITDFPIVGTSYKDKNVENGVTYYYVLRAVYKDKTLGPISNEVSVRPKLGKNTIMLKVGSKYMTIDGNRREIDPGKGTAMIIKNGRTFLPIRAAIEAMGGSVSWQASKQKVTINLKGTTMELWIGSKIGEVNGKKRESDMAPYLSDTGRTMLPLRFIVENLGCDVDWDGPTQTVTIKK
ncbi:MAG: stalk domain-containing protein [Bacillota bacterium]